ncbi:MAG: DUF1700 domain-containing protein [Lachnospiraceae bacterium]|nr:DUF1700 domain-containing protein [Lachnospiraceae bacterium]MBP1585910.1 DUF1700 domain-containing protein [Lachnospiraceae bacterium]
MLKQEFLAQLRSGLEAASIEDIDECIEFYDEMISDRIESGMNEESAVAQMESIDSIISNYKAEKPVAKLIMDKVQKSHDEAKGKGKGALWIVLAIIGFPIWLPILLVVLALLLTLYILLWCIVIAVFCVLITIGAVAIAGLFIFIMMFTGIVPWPLGIFSLGAGLFLGGLAVLLWKPIWSLCRSIAGMIPAIFKKIKKGIA